MTQILISSTLALLCATAFASPAVPTAELPAGPAQLIIAPTAPPPPRVETVPPPVEADPAELYWWPGHWVWSEGGWQWKGGAYGHRPMPAAVWEPGHWVQQPNGSRAWVGEALQY